MGSIFWDKNNQQKAKEAWVKAYLIAKKIDLAEILDGLESLAEQIGLDGGLEGWETLAKQMEK